MITKVVPYFLVVVLMVALSGCGKREPLVQVESAPLNAPATATLDQVGKAILDAGESRRWKMTVTKSGEISGEIFVRNKHTAIVKILYDTEKISIFYQSSINLNYKEERSVVYIHPNYNVWVRLLKQAIQERVAAN